MNISKKKNINDELSIVGLGSTTDELVSLRIKSFDSETILALENAKPVSISSLNTLASVGIFNSPDDNKKLEDLRVFGFKIGAELISKKINVVQVVSIKKDLALAFTEGLLLGQYKFDKYITKKSENKVSEVQIVCDSIDQSEIDELLNEVEAVYETRDLVNEPQSFLTATQLSAEIERMSKVAGFKVEVFNKQKIEALKMGGLLAVNKGSVEPPTFNIMEHKPANAVNDKPYVLVGKGVVYDTGGLSLKPTAKSMDFMKSDMGGAAAVIGTMYSVSKNNLPIWLIGLVPSTDNRPSGAAYAPGDVITMFNNRTVEVLNTDAEGRMILADALTYAIKYNPELVIDLATLTGAAARTVGTQAIVSMGTAADDVHQSLKNSGFAVHERVAEMPFYDEYWDMLKSDIADLTNLGGVEAGAITAGKFLEFFTKNEDGEHAYPWIHLDIAGPAFLHSGDKYRTKGGSGIGVRLLYNFFKSRC